MTFPLYLLLCLHVAFVPFGVATAATVGCATINFVSGSVTPVTVTAAEVAQNPVISVTCTVPQFVALNFTGSVANVALSVSGNFLAVIFSGTATNVSVSLINTAVLAQVNTLGGTVSFLGAANNVSVVVTNGNFVKTQTSSSAAVATVPLQAVVGFIGAASLVSVTFADSLLQCDSTAGYSPSTRTGCAAVVFASVVSRVSLSLQRVSFATTGYNSDSVVLFSDTTASLSDITFSSQNSIYRASSLMLCSGPQVSALQFSMNSDNVTLQRSTASILTSSAVVGFPVSSSVVQMLSITLSNSTVFANQDSMGWFYIVASLGSIYNGSLYIRDTSSLMWLDAVYAVMVAADGRMVMEGNSTIIGSYTASIVNTRSLIRFSAVVDTNTVVQCGSFAFMMANVTNVSVTIRGQSTINALNIISGEYLLRTVVNITEGSTILLNTSQLPSTTACIIGCPYLNGSVSTVGVYVSLGSTVSITAYLNGASLVSPMASLVTSLAAASGVQVVIREGSAVSLTTVLTTTAAAAVAVAALSPFPSAAAMMPYYLRSSMIVALSDVVNASVGISSNSSVSLGATVNALVVSIGATGEGTVQNVSVSVEGGSVVSFASAGEKSATIRQHSGTVIPINESSLILSSGSIRSAVITVSDNGTSVSIDNAFSANVAAMGVTLTAADSAVVAVFGSIIHSPASGAASITFRTGSALLAAGVLLAYPLLLDSTSSVTMLSVSFSGASLRSSYAGPASTPWTLWPSVIVSPISYWNITMEWSSMAVSTGWWQLSTAALPPLVVLPDCGASMTWVRVTVDSCDIRLPVDCSSASLMGSSYSRYPTSWVVLNASSPLLLQDVGLTVRWNGVRGAIGGGMGSASLCSLTAVNVMSRVVSVSTTSTTLVDGLNVSVADASSSSQSTLLPAAMLVVDTAGTVSRTCVWVENVTGLLHGGSAPSFIALRSRNKGNVSVVQVTLVRLNITTASPIDFVTLRVDYDASVSFANVPDTVGDISQVVVLLRDASTIDNVSSLLTLARYDGQSDPPPASTPTLDVRLRGGSRVSSVAHGVVAYNATAASCAAWRFGVSVFEGSSFTVQSASGLGLLLYLAPSDTAATASTSSLSACATTPDDGATATAVISVDGGGRVQAIGTVNKVTSLVHVTLQTPWVLPSVAVNVTGFNSSLGIRNHVSYLLEDVRIASIVSCDDLGGDSDADDDATITLRRLAVALDSGGRLELRAEPPVSDVYAIPSWATAVLIIDMFTTQPQQSVAVAQSMSLSVLRGSVANISAIGSVDSSTYQHWVEHSGLLTAGVGSTTNVVVDQGSSLMVAGSGPLIAFGIPNENNVSVGDGGNVERQIVVNVTNNSVLAIGSESIARFSAVVAAYSLLPAHTSPTATVRIGVSQLSRIQFTAATGTGLTRRHVVVASGGDGSGEVMMGVYITISSNSALSTVTGVALPPVSSVFDAPQSALFAIQDISTLYASPLSVHIADGSRVNVSQLVLLQNASLAVVNDCSAPFVVMDASSSVVIGSALRLESQSTLSSSSGPDGGLCMTLAGAISTPAQGSLVSQVNSSNVSSPLIISGTGSGTMVPLRNPFTSLPSLCMAVVTASANTCLMLHVSGFTVIAAGGGDISLLCAASDATATVPSTLTPALVNVSTSNVRLSDTTLATQVFAIDMLATSFDTPWDAWQRTTIQLASNLNCVWNASYCSISNPIGAALFPLCSATTATTSECTTTTPTSSSVSTMPETSTAIETTTTSVPPVSTVISTTTSSTSALPASTTTVEPSSSSTPTVGTQSTSQATTELTTTVEPSSSSTPTVGPQSTSQTTTELTTTVEPSTSTAGATNATQFQSSTSAPVTTTASDTTSVPPTTASSSPASTEPSTVATSTTRVVTNNSTTAAPPSTSVPSSNQTESTSSIAMQTSTSTAVVTSAPLATTTTTSPSSANTTALLVMTSSIVAAANGTNVVDYIAATLRQTLALATAPVVSLKQNTSRNLTFEVAFMTSSERDSAVASLTNQTSTVSQAFGGSVLSCAPVLPATAAPTTATPSSTTTATPPASLAAPAESSSNSTTIAVAVVVPLAVILLAAVGFFMWKRQQSNRPTASIDGELETELVTRPTVRSMMEVPKTPAAKEAPPMLQEPLVIVTGAGDALTIAAEDEEGFYDDEGYYHYYVDDEDVG